MLMDNRNLNIHYSAPDHVWEELAKIYALMPGWIGYYEGCPHWYSTNGDEKHIIASVEPSGILFTCNMEQDEFEAWFDLIKKKTTNALGYPVGEPEDGFDFKYWD